MKPREIVSFLNLSSFFFARSAAIIKHDVY